MLTLTAYRRLMPDTADPGNGGTRPPLPARADDPAMHSSPEPGPATLNGMRTAA